MASPKLMLINCEDAEKWQGFECVWDHFLSRPVRDDKWQYFNATRGDIPAVDSVRSGDVMLLTGSHYSADQDLPWIHKLAAALPQFAAAGVRIIACCFGHQLLALALGGKIGRNPTGRFVLGVEDIRCSRQACKQAGLLRPLQDALADAGGLKVPDHLDPDEVIMQQIESHGDCVTDLPPGAMSLATSSTATHEMWALGPNVLAFQFHPGKSHHLEPCEMSQLAQYRAGATTESDGTLQQFSWLQFMTSSLSNMMGFSTARAAANATVHGDTLRADLAPRIALEKILSGLRSSGKLTPEEADSTEASLTGAATCPSGPATQQEEVHKAEATERAAEAADAVVPEGQVHPALMEPLLRSAPAFHKVLHWFMENGLSLPVVEIPRRDDSALPAASGTAAAAAVDDSKAGGEGKGTDQGVTTGQASGNIHELADGVAELAVAGKPAESGAASKAAGAATALEQLISNTRKGFDTGMQNTLVDYKQLSDMNGVAASNCSAAAAKAKELTENCAQLKMQGASAQRALDSLPQLDGLLDQLGQVVNVLDAQSSALATQVGVAPAQPPTTSSMLSWGSGSK